MNVYTNTKFTGHYPVGVAAVVVAENTDQAAHLLNVALELRGLPKSAKAEEFVQLSTAIPNATVLNDGDY